MTFRILPLLAVALVATAAQAQAPMKVAYLDSERIVENMPEYETVQQQLAVQQQNVGAQVRAVQDSLQQVLQTRYEAYQAFVESPVASDSAKANRGQELMRLQGQIEEVEVRGLQFLGAYEARLVQPLNNRLQLAIQSVAQAQSIDLVLPATVNNAPAILYVSDRPVDITEAVLGELGIELVERPAPPPPVAPGN